MLAAKFFGKHDVRIAQYPVPEIAEDELLLRVAVCGICGTDLHIFEGEHPLARGPPMIAGHEFCGTVERVGPKVADIVPGDRVAVEPNLFCGQCHYCRTARKHFCENWTAIGVTRDGGFAEFATIPRQAAYVLPPQVSFSKGALFEPAACVLHGIMRAEVKPGDSVVLCGAGPIGLLFVQLLKRAGAGELIVVDLDSAKLEAARGLGADLAVNPDEVNLREVVMDSTDGFGADIAIDATGSPEAISGLFDLVQYAGKLLFFGVSPERAEIPLRPFEVYRKELTIVGAFTNPYTNVAAVNLLNEIDVGSIVTHQIPLERLVEDGFNAIREKQPGVVKVQVVFNRGDCVARFPLR